MRRNIELVIGIILLSAAAAYYCFHAGYLATPSEDYLGNFLPFTKAVLSFEFRAIADMLLPAYPFLLAALSKLFHGRDPVLQASLVLNFLLLVPYFIGAYLVFSRFLSKRMTAAALFFLAVNSYTLYSALNPELEIFLATITLWTFALLARGSRFDLVTASIAAVTKWDSVFIVPAVVWRRFFPGFRWKRAFIAGVIACVPFAAWYGYVTWLNAGRSSNIYVMEIASRGPNIYRYLVDAFLVPTGFVQWTGIDIYRSFPSAFSIFAAAAVLVFALIVLALIIAGIRHFARTDHPLRAPVAFYAIGFILIHMIYQNTKDKYVLPIVWLITLIAFIGLERWGMPLFLRFAASRKRLAASVAVSALMLCVAFICVVRTGEPVLALFAAVLSAAWVSWLYAAGRARGALFAAAAFFSVFVIGMNVAYGRTILDHYSKRRVEFKLAGEWLRDNSPRDSVIVASEDSVVRYYSEMPRENIVMVKDLPMKTDTLESLDLCLSLIGADYIYIDDFYIRRLRTHDKNAIDRKAPLLEKLKSGIGSNPRFTLVKKIHVDPDINGSIYRVNDL